jgi:hypothetical protein
MLSNRLLQVFLGVSHKRQRFSSDIIKPFSSLNLFQFADDIALTHQASKFEECEIHLEEGLETLSRFLHQ